MLLEITTTQRWNEGIYNKAYFSILYLKRL